MLSLLLISLAAAKEVVLNWNISYVENANPDKLSPSPLKKVVGVNGAWPIPGVEAVEGDVLIVNVVNSLPVVTSLHFHGLFQKGNSYYDGAPGVSFCGIAPGSNFTYTVPLEQNGAYWIHGHSSGQYVDGLRAPLVIHPKPRGYYLEGLTTNEITLTFGDWYHTPHSTLLTSYLNQSNPEGFEPVPDSNLINDGLDPNITFVPGQQYLLRLISVSAFAGFQIYIDDHPMTVVQVDGVDVYPYTVDALPLAAAQRYTVIVTAKPSDSSNFMLHSKMDQSMFNQPSLNPNTSVIITYNPNSPVAPDTGVQDKADDFDQNALVPSLPMTASPQADQQFILNTTFEVRDDKINHGTFNNIIYSSPDTPVTLAALSDTPSVMQSSFYGKNTNAMVLQPGKSIEIVVNNFDTGSHPFHLHGHVFQVLETRANATYDSSTAKLNLDNPIRRDTTVIPAGGYAVLRFISNNPGAWFFHCHIDWHFEGGLAAVFVESPEEMKKTLTVPRNVIDQCSALGKPTTAK